MIAFFGFSARVPVLSVLDSFVYLQLYFCTSNTCNFKYKSYPPEECERSTAVDQLHVEESKRKYRKRDQLAVLSCD